MFKYFVIFVLTLTLYSCQETKEVTYSTETLQYLKKLSSALNNDEAGKTMEILNNNGQDYKFAKDLKESFEDSLTIHNAQELTLKGDFKQAKAILNNRISQRGFSEVLESSLKRLEKAERLHNYLTDSKDMDLVETAREFAQLKAHTLADFKNIPGFEQWVKREAEKISEQIKADKSILLANLNFTRDYLYLSNPNLTEVILLQTGLVENEKLIPGYEDTLPKPHLIKLKTIGVNKLITENASLKNLSKLSSNNLQNQLLYTQSLAKKGDLVGTMTSLQELENKTNLHENYRRDILKTLFLAKGWSDNSLINRDFIDISYLLEMVYRINQ